MLIETIDAEAPDLIVLAGMMIMMPVELVRKYHNRIINVHPALIPSFCGEGLLWNPSARGCFEKRCEGNRRYGAFCG